MKGNTVYSHDHDAHDAHGDAHHHTGEQVPPWMRPAEPDHPMSLEGGVIEGDTEMLLRCLCEEMLLMGTPHGELLRMSANPEYQALYAARAALGDDRADSVIAEVCARFGTHRHKVWETPEQERTTALTLNGRQAGRANEGD